MIRLGVTDFGMTQKPCCAHQAIQTRAGWLPSLLATETISGRSMILGLPVVLLPVGE